MTLKQVWTHSGISLAKIVNNIGHSTHFCGILINTTACFQNSYLSRLSYLFFCLRLSFVMLPSAGSRSSRQSPLSAEDFGDSPSASSSALPPAAMSTIGECVTSGGWENSFTSHCTCAVSYTHLTLPTS